MIQQEISQGFPELFGSKRVNGRELDVYETIATLTRELDPLISKALSGRRSLLQDAAPVREKYAWPQWSERFEDPAGGGAATYREIVQGLIDNFLGHETPLRWRLNDEVPVPPEVHPLANPGLELTGPWAPLDMAFNALNSEAPMNMPDFEDASPAHFRPEGAGGGQPIGVFAALRNARQIFEGQWAERAYEVEKKGKTRAYRLAKPPAEWPKRFVRPPGLHIRFEHVQVDGHAAPGLVVVVVLWALNNHDALRKLGTGLYYYIPKLQTPREALIVEKLFARLEAMMGLAIGTIKIKMLYEEGNGGRYLPAILWTLRRRLLGTNVGRWDYLGSLIEMWKDDASGVFPDPQSIGMASPNMIAYQQYNALLMLMAAMRDGEMTQGGPIGGMAAVMIYQDADLYGRSRYNQLAFRAIEIDKLRERLLGLIFVPDGGAMEGVSPTLAEILAGKARGRLYDTYRQSWVASPEKAYVEAGNRPLRARLTELQAMLDAPRSNLEINGKPVPVAGSGLSEAELQLFHSRGLVNLQGGITPRVLQRALLDTPEKLLSPELWESIYGVPMGEVTIEHIQHAFYMAANYGYQILNGNFAAAIDDYELRLRFMNDLATYRIDMSWLWTLLRHQATITRDGHLRQAVLTEDGVVPGRPAEAVKAGTRFTPELFEKVWRYHGEWTAKFFAEQDRRGDTSRFDRSKAMVIMELLRRQLLSPRYVQHSARLLFVMGEAGERERAQVLDAVFELTREEVARRVESGEYGRSVLDAHDYILDVFAETGVLAAH